ncbi:hypothetical protein ACNKHV_19000 [Shigella flexneri]
MSVSAFHQISLCHQHLAVAAFEELPSHKARMTIIHDGMKASAAAMRVGYESASQLAVNLNVTSV